jgi:hypothetical protein
MAKKSAREESSLTGRDAKVNLFSVAASEALGSTPEAAGGDLRAEGHHRDPHLIEVPADVLRELFMVARQSTENAAVCAKDATAFRDWTVGVMLQLAEVAKDGVAHLDQDEIEVARHVLEFIANAPQRLGLAPEGRHA